MNIEDKDLLLQDLSAKFPYQVFCSVSDRGDNGAHFRGSFRLKNIQALPDVDNYPCLMQFDGLSSFYDLNEIRPELFSINFLKRQLFVDGQAFTPLDKLIEYLNTKNYGRVISLENFDIIYDNILMAHNLQTYEAVPLTMMIDIIEWLDRHHFDTRGLLNKNLAIEIEYDNNVYGEIDFC